jgi:hypothetical protein
MKYCFSESVIIPSHTVRRRPSHDRKPCLVTKLNFGVLGQFWTEIIIIYGYDRQLAVCVILHFPISLLSILQPDPPSRIEVKS